jgi:hypothetical protein
MNDPFVLNLKMMSNDISQLRDRAYRMWASVDNDDMAFLEMLEKHLEILQTEIRNKIDKS